MSVKQVLNMLDQQSQKEKKDVLILNDVLIHGTTRIINDQFYRSQLELQSNDKFLRLLNFSEPLGPINYYFASKKIDPKLIKSNLVQNKYQISLNQVRYFGLVDDSFQQNLILLPSSDTQYFLKAYNYGQVKYIKREKTEKEKNLNFFQQILNFDTLKLKFTYGYQRLEYGIKFGEPLNVLGNIIYNKKTKILRFFGKKIIGSQQDIQTQVSQVYLKSLIETITYLSVYFIIFNIFTLRELKILFARKKGVEISQIKSAKIRDNNQSLNCQSCEKNVREIIYDPCGHFSYCQNCYLQLLQNKCDVCDQEIKSTLKVFSC